MCKPMSEQMCSVLGHRGGGGAETLARDKQPTTMARIEDAVPDTPAERLQSLLDEAAALNRGVDDYLRDMTSPASEAAQRLEHKTRTADWAGLFEKGETLFEFSPRWTTDVVEAKALAMFAKMVRAEHVLEIGMFTGYGALTVAEALPPHGRMVTFELDPFLEAFSRPVFDSSPHGKKIDVRVGDALAMLKAWDASDKFDMVFVDADKGGYGAYYDTVLDRDLLAPGGVLVVDNTLFKGAPALGPSPADVRGWNCGGAAIAAFNAKVRDDPRVEQVLLPIRDGVTVIRRVDAAPPEPFAAAPVPAPPSPARPRRDVAAMAPPAAPARDDVVAATPARDDVVAATPVLDRLRLDGQTALVTGGGQGIGRAFAHALAEAGAAVCVADLDGDRAATVQRELEAKGAKALAVEADCADPEAIAAMVQRVVDAWGALDIAVNNAGVNKNSKAEETPLADWDLTFALNTRGVFLACQAEAKHMLARGKGKIINTASMASLLVPHPQCQAAYNCSKAAVVKLTQSLACEWASRGVRVNCISPGIVDTPLIWDNPALNKLAATWLDQIPAGRLATVQDLQAAVVYLASGASDYMVGHNLVIEGGQSLW